jgi:ABC-type lipoprotein release transport system permease subunit
MVDAYLVRLAARNALRNRRRSLFTLTSILLGVSLFIVSRSFVDGIDATLIAIEVDNESAHVRVVPRDYLAEEDYQPLDKPFPDAPALAATLAGLAPGTRVVDRVSFAAEVGDGVPGGRAAGPPG